MGDRAIITTKADIENDGTCVYLHWNGSEEWVRTYLGLCEIYGFRSPSKDPMYGYARLCQVIANTFDTGLSIGVGPVNPMLHMADWDNGVYIIEGWRIRSNLVGEMETRVKDAPVEYSRIKLCNLMQSGAFQLNTDELIRALDDLNAKLKEGA